MIRSKVMFYFDWEDFFVFFDFDEFVISVVIIWGEKMVVEVFGIFDDLNEVMVLGEYEFDYLSL